MSLIVGWGLYNGQRLLTRWFLINPVCPPADWSPTMRDLLQEILAQYALPRFGTHGISHWARVLETGFRLGQETGADPQVLELFAVLHDSRRVNEGIDLDHGRRAAEYAVTLRGSLIHLADADFDLLYHACACHTDGLTTGDRTVQTCWDADRLDLGRVDITPTAEYLCTQSAKEPAIIAWAEERSRGRFVPELVHSAWGLHEDGRAR